MCVLGGGCSPPVRAMESWCMAQARGQWPTLAFGARPQQGPSAVLGLIPFSAQLSSGKA